MADFTLNREDWSLHRKGYLDQSRHCEKVREAIRNNLADIISEESIVLSDGNNVLKVPIRSIEEYHFRYEEEKMPHVGQGDGKSVIGDLVGRDSAGRPVPEKGRGAGNEPGVDYYEAEVTIDDISEMLFADLVLPYLDGRKKPRLVSGGMAFRDIRKNGVMANLDRRRTLFAAIKRNALRGRPAKPVITVDDLRFKAWENVQRPETSAAVLAMMDTSGSMGPFEKYIARTFFFWMVRFLRTKYENVEIVFLAHHTTARETTEEEFFSKGESGGTRCSPVYELAQRIITKRYPLSDFNVYAFHFSDGDNLSSDNDVCVETVLRLLPMVTMVGYGEIEGPYYYTNTLRTSFKRIEDPRFMSLVIRDKSEVYGALKAFFHHRGGR